MTAAPVQTILSALDAAGCRPRPSRGGWAAKCPAHEDRSPSLSVTEGDGGRVLLRCFAGCTAAAILASLGLTWQHTFADGAPYRQEGGPVRVTPTPRATPAPVPEPLPPVPNRELLDRVVAHGLANVDTPAAAPFLAKRGLSPEVCRVFAVGFMPWIRFTGWRCSMPNVWTIPIPDAAGNVLALKLHRENAPVGRPKGLWAPLGTAPTDRPRHGWATLWPPPERFLEDTGFQERAAVLEYDAGLPRAEAERRAALVLPPLYLCPGELKALAILGAGRQAVSVTAGESFRWTPGLIARLAHRRVILCFDDDPAGRRFRDATTAALRDHVAGLKTVTFGHTTAAVHSSATGANASE